MTDTPSRPAPQQACPECKGAGGWASTARGRGVGGQTVTMCEFCNDTGAAPQQEQAARFEVRMHRGILPMIVDTYTKHEWVSSPVDTAYARAIAAALNASPPKETT